MNNSYLDKAGRYEIKTVRIEDVDKSIYDYFDKKIAIHIDRDDSLYKVPVLYSVGERWALIRKNNFRDEHGVLILPIVSVRRLNIDRTREQGGMAQEQKSITVSKVIHPKTSNAQNLIDTNKRRGIFFQPKEKPIIETLTIPFPDFCQVMYEISIWTQFNTHMNEILEKIFYKYEHLDSFVMPVDYDGNKPKGDGYYFVGFREGTIDKKSNDESYTNQERLIQYTYNIRVPVYLILSPQDEPLSYGRDEEGKAIVYKKQSVNKIKLSEEILSFEEFAELFG
jgi:hypothetical protein